MTRKEIEQAQKTLPSLYTYQEWTKEQRQLRRELSCREMINSILVYDGEQGLYDEDGQLDRYLQEYANEKYKNLDAWYIGGKRVLELIEEQKADFAKAQVTTNAYTDAEGCTYNSVKWADEF